MQGLLDDVVNVCQYTLLSLQRSLASAASVTGLALHLSANSMKCLLAFTKSVPNGPA